MQAQAAHLPSSLSAAQPIERATISEAVRSLRTQFILRNRAASYFDINGGLCDDFADELLNKLVPEGAEADSTVMVVETGNFRVAESETEWDATWLAKYWNVSVPEGFTWAEMCHIDFGYHVWLTAGGLHFDAECPEGVASFFDLPLFRRYLITAGRQKGLRMPDLETEDVKPAPLCPVPMPA